MTNLVVENLRLKELILVVNKNRAFFDEFVRFIQSYGYPHIHNFVTDIDQQRVQFVLRSYFSTPFATTLFDGIARPYNDAKSKWFFITWLLRDAPQQRLQPIVSSLSGSPIDNKIWVVMKIMAFVAPLLPCPSQWEWSAISEVMLQRIEGSRRALKGGLFEAIVRSQLVELFRRHQLRLRVTPNEVKLHDETYDVEVAGTAKKILMPVKTRETMGGGHALLFTRDIHKSISVAHDNGFECIPVVIAESWAGNLDDLPCSNFIYIQMNPNQVDKINPILEQKLENLVGFFQMIQ
ncbi:hypothetical protein [Rheinheimera sp. 1928-s]|uniref:hypothetical protein n=1 Tax=Rheinheimera sp. 1928-s TaxID=3033803 RepID=UPI002620853A|nr:hypothetical protein [Rheinheimera sp. 1928-s]MDF3124680.1 hypothetical protein [Rheinheimera sp. 1928-s]